MRLTDPDGFYRLQGLEVLTGWVGGELPPRAVASPPGDIAHPRLVVERLLLDLLQRQPCAVAFSGGRDSAALLALATHLARQHALPDPIPVTNVFPGDPHGEDEQVQESLVRALQLDDWQRVPIVHEHDYLGPHVAPRIRRFGLLFPLAAHTTSTLYPFARNGVLITGEGGDETLGPQRTSSLLEVWARRGRPLGKCAVVAAYALGPRWLRRSLLARSTGDLAWLRDHVRAEVRRELVGEQAREPLPWASAKLSLLRRRGVTLGYENLRVLAAQDGVELVSPLAAADFVSAIARLGGFKGFRSRTDLMRILFQDVLPAPVIERTSKARFNRVVMGAYSREFARTWDGSGVDDDLVDPAALREEWLSEQPDARTHALLLSAWLATGARDVRLEGVTA